MYEFVSVLRKRVKHACKVVGYGHLADGNVHVNLIAPKYEDSTQQLIEPFVFELVGN